MNKVSSKQPLHNILVGLSFICVGILSASTVAATTAPLSQPEITRCPSTFHQVPIPKKAKQCQSFDAELPASLIYFIADSPDAIVANYLAELPELALKSHYNDRVLMVSEQQNVRIVVSPDGEGTQVDILVLPTDELRLEIVESK